METRADEFVTQAREHLTALEQLLAFAGKARRSPRTTVSGSMAA